jgi:hypothetical protein
MARRHHCGKSVLPPPRLRAPLTGAPPASRRGDSFHFAHRYKHETLRESIRRHEHFLALKLGLDKTHKARPPLGASGAQADGRGAPAARCTRRRPRTRTHAVPAAC